MLEDSNPTVQTVCGTQHLWRLWVQSHSCLASCWRIPPLDLVMVLVESLGCFTLVDHEQAFTKCHFKSCSIGKVAEACFHSHKKMPTFPLQHLIPSSQHSKKLSGVSVQAILMIFFFIQFFIIVIHNQSSVIQIWMLDKLLSQPGLTGQTYLEKSIRLSLYQVSEPLTSLRALSHEILHYLFHSPEMFH